LSFFAFASERCVEASEITEGSKMSDRMDRVDQRLVPFLSATDSAEAERSLGEVLAELRPVVQGIVRRKIGRDSPGAEADDLHSEVMVKVLDRLEGLRANPHTEPIADLRSYVAVVAYNACNALLRRKHPRRWQLKNRIRYVMTHQGGFALWEGERAEMLCALDRWRDSAVVARGRVEEIVAKPSFPLSGNLAEAKIANLRQLLHAILEQAGGPVELDILVSGLAAVHGIEETPARYPTDALENVADSRADFASTTEARSYLHRLWDEIRDLPLRQRTALLLNLRDLHEGVIALLPLTGVASIRQIAEMLEIPVDDFARLWNDLPIDDATIALRLGITGQQVINLRKSGRARLARRMRGK
jgi:DNA-directed RNA polymerase specialized sigma24 family protein